MIQKIEYQIAFINRCLFNIKNEQLKTQIKNEYYKYKEENYPNASLFVLGKTGPNQIKLKTRQEILSEVNDYTSINSNIRDQFLNYNSKYSKPLLTIA